MVGPVGAAESAPQLKSFRYKLFKNPVSARKTHLAIAGETFLFSSCPQKGPLLVQFFVVPPMPTQGLREKTSSSTNSLEDFEQILDLSLLCFTHLPNGYTILIHLSQ